MAGQVLGFIGLGRMGGPMSLRLIDAGYSLCVFDTDAAAMKPLVARGAKAAASPAEVAVHAEIVLVSLPTPPIVQAVALGEQGIVHGSAARTVIDLSTTGPGMANRRRHGPGGAQHRLGGRAGQRRHRGRQGRHPGGYGLVSEGDLPDSGADPKNFRAPVLHRREARPRADGEAREQPAGRGGAGGLLRSGRDGREGGPRPQGDDRHHQRQQRPQQRDAGQVPEIGADPAPSISASPPASPTRTYGCAWTKPRRSACRWS